MLPSCSSIVSFLLLSTLLIACADSSVTSGDDDVIDLDVLSATDAIVPDEDSAQTLTDVESRADVAGNDTLLPDAATPDGSVPDSFGRDFTLRRRDNTLHPTPHRNLGLQPRRSSEQHLRRIRHRRGRHAIPCADLGRRALRD